MVKKKRIGKKKLLSESELWSQGKICETEEEDYSTASSGRTEKRYSHFMADVGFQCHLDKPCELFQIYSQAGSL